MLTVCFLIASAAYTRTESRGTHYRLDFRTATTSTGGSTGVATAERNADAGSGRVTTVTTTPPRRVWGGRTHERFISDGRSLPAATKSVASKWPRRLRIALGAFIALLVVVELVARLRFGLGNPPLMQADPKMEYLYQPNQTTRRFGNFIHFNAYSMRSDDFPLKKSSPDELRILVIGDSVINGGAQTDQAQLATSIIQRELSQKLKRKVIVGNASASSWGPQNELEYLKQLPGLMDADILVIVESSHDVVDVPTFDPVINVALDMPDHKPLCAISELINRYLLPRLMARFSRAPVWPAQTPQTPNNPDAIRSLAALREMIAMGKAHARGVIIAQFIEHREANGTLQPGHDMIRDAAQSAGAEVIQFAPAFNAELNAGRDPSRDPFYHPNAHGQRVMADVLIDAIKGGMKNAE